MKNVVLKPGREKSLQRRHPWIFSGAIATKCDWENGEIRHVQSHSGEYLATAYFHAENSLAGRVLSFSKEDVLELIEHRIVCAQKQRRLFFDFSKTNAFRLINAESDGLPGLIVDQYADCLVVQVNTWGIERLKTQIIDALVRIVRPKAIYEKSVSSARRQDGLPDFQGWIWGTPLPEVQVIENGVKFAVAVEEGQKTGLFLDQREMRSLIASLAKDKTVLNCFAYTGGFSFFALKGGAKRVDSVDICPKACARAECNVLLNGFDPNHHRAIATDAFSFLEKDSLAYDLIILDPPAFAKKRADEKMACQGYKEINRRALAKMPSGSLLLTCSCSHFIDEPLFKNLIFQSACEAGRKVSVLSRHRQAFDHAVSIYHPEGEYLKSLLLFVE